MISRLQCLEDIYIGPRRYNILFIAHTLVCSLSILPRLRHISLLSFTLCDTWKEVSVSVYSSPEDRWLRDRRNKRTHETGEQVLSSRLEQIASLHTLQLSHCELGSGGFGLFQETMRKLTAITALSINDCIPKARFQDDLLPLFAESVTNLTNLKELSLAAQKVGSATFWSIAPQLQSRTNLQKIGLRYCSLEDTAVDALALCLDRLTNLRHIDLLRNNLECTGILLVLCQITHLVHLTHLDIGANPIRNIDVSVLAAFITVMPSLEFLGIRELNRKSDLGRCPPICLEIFSAERDAYFWENDD